MNEQDVFRKIILGVKFDQDKFVKNSQRFYKVPTKQLRITDIKPSLELDFFKSEKSACIEKNLTTVNGHGKKTLNKLCESPIESETDCSSGFEDNLEKTLKRKLKNSCNEQKIHHKKVKLIHSSSLRKLHKIYVEGSDIPELITTFEQLQSVYGFNKICLQNIVDKMGFNKLTPIQMQVSCKIYDVFFTFDQQNYSFMFLY